MRPCDGAGKNNAFLCKRKQAGGVQFSRDPMNLTNKHSRKNAGFLNDKAIGIQPDSNTARFPHPTLSHDCAH
jgi:large subunit ribosomal protein L28e